MTMGEAIWTVVNGLWWLPLPFVLGKSIVHFSRKLGRYRNFK